MQGVCKGQNSIEYSNQPLSHFTWTVKYSEYQHLRKTRVSLFKYASFKDANYINACPYNVLANILR